jgi:serine protease Do
VIIKVNGKEIESSAELRKTIVTKSPGSQVEFTIIREGKEITIKATLGEAPSEPMALKEDTSSKKTSERLGLDVANLNTDLTKKYGVNQNETGVVVTEIDQNGPAFRGGLREGDVIKRVGRQDVKAVKEFAEAVSKIGKNDTALFLISRKGTSLFIAFNIPN